MKNRTISNIIFGLTLISLPLSFSLCATLGEANIFGVAGLVRYSWIMWLFIPVGGISLFVGKVLKDKNEKYAKNYICAFLCVPVLFLFGSFRFVFTDSISYDNREIFALAEKTDTIFPNTIKTATNKLERYKVSYVKITDAEEKIKFENALKNNGLWKNKLDTRIKEVLPLDIQMQTMNSDYYLFYNLSDGRDVPYPSSGKDTYVFIAYDCEWQRFIILNDYTINWQ